MARLIREIQLVVSFPTFDWVLACFWVHDYRYKLWVLSSGVFVSPDEQSWFELSVTEVSAVFSRTFRLSVKATLIITSPRSSLSSWSYLLGSRISRLWHFSWETSSCRRRVLCRVLSESLNSCRVRFTFRWDVAFVLLLCNWTWRWQGHENIGQQDCSGAAIV